MSLREDYEANLYKPATLFRMVSAYFLYPEFTVVVLIRLQSHLSRGGRLKRLLSRLVRRHISRCWGCYISPYATIGKRLRLPHPIGIVIGEGAIIGDDALIFQHVTLGTRSFSMPAYPKIGNRVLIGANATVLGNIVIGDDAKIGAGAVVVKNVDTHAVATCQYAASRPVEKSLLPEGCRT